MSVKAQNLREVLGCWVEKGCVIAEVGGVTGARWRRVLNAKPLFSL